MSNAETQRGDEVVQKETVEAHNTAPQELDPKVIAGILEGQKSAIEKNKAEIADLERELSSLEDAGAQEALRQEIKGIEDEIAEITASMQDLERQKQAVEEAEHKEKVVTEAKAALATSTDILASMKPMLTELLEFHIQNGYGPGEWNKKPHTNVEGKPASWVAEKTAIKNLTDFSPKGIKDIQTYIDGSTSQGSELDSFSAPLAQLRDELNATVEDMKKQLTIIKVGDASAEDTIKMALARAKKEGFDYDMDGSKRPASPDAEYFAKRKVAAEVYSKHFQTIQAENRQMAESNLRAQEQRRAELQSRVYNAEEKLSQDPNFLKAHEAFKTITDRAVEEIKNFREQLTSQN